MLAYNNSVYSSLELCWVISRLSGLDTWLVLRVPLHQSFSCRESFRHLHFLHASWASWGSLWAHKLDSFQKDTRRVPELHLVQLELLMDIQPPKLAEKSTGKIPGNVYNVNVGWLFLTVQLVNVEFRRSHSPVGRISPISVIADWARWSVVAPGEKAAFPWALHPLLLWIMISLLAYAWSWDLVLLRTWTISEWLQEEYF